MDLLRPNHAIPLRPELLLTDQLPSLSGLTAAAKDFSPVVQYIESQRIALEARAAREVDSKLTRAKAKADPEELDALRRRGIYEKAKSFRGEGGRAVLPPRLPRHRGLPAGRHAVRRPPGADRGRPAHPRPGGVQGHGSPVTQQQVREFASKVEYAAGVDKRPYQAILVARSGFANNAHTVAETLRVHLQTYEQLLRSLVDLRPNLDAAVLAFRGTALERMYVEQDMVFEGDIKPGRTVEPKPLTAKSCAGWASPRAPSSPCSATSAAARPASPNAWPASWRSRHGRK